MAKNAKAISGKNEWDIPMHLAMVTYDVSLTAALSGGR